MKGQLTLEYMVLFLVFILVTSTIFFAVILIKESFEKSIDLIEFKSSAEKINLAADKVCALGSGNKILIDLEFEINLKYCDTGIGYGYKNFSIAKKLLCKANGENTIFGKVMVENRDGEIYIKKG